MNCLSCGATTTNGLALCDLCRYAVTEWLESLPAHFRNLSRDRRPGRPNGSLGGSGTWLIRQGEVDTSLIQTALGKAMNDLTTWARALADDRGVETPEAETEADTVAALCAWFTEHLTSISTLEWAGQFIREIDKHNRALSALTALIPGWYAGQCRQVTGRSMEGDIFTCGTDTYVIPGVRWLTCPGCGATTAARDHLPIVLEEASDWYARPMRLAEAIVALVDSELSVRRLYERIHKWGQRGDITAAVRPTTRVHKFDFATEQIVVGEEEVGQPRYRLGDVLDVLATRGATRTGDMTAKAG